MKHSDTSADRTRPPISSVNRFLSGLSEEFRPSSLLPNLTAGFVIGLSNIIFALSFGALIFSGSLSAYASVGIGLALFATMVNVLLIALFTSMSRMVSKIQEAPATILVLLVASLGAKPFSSPEAQLSTVIVAIAISSLVTGVVCFLLGFFQLGNLARFMPYPVIGGFLAATGWFILLGGLALMTNLPLQKPWQLVQLLTPDVILRWLPGVLFALLLIFATKRIKNVLTLPLAILLAIAVFHLLRILLGTSIESALEAGWLLGPFPEGGMWQPIRPAMLTQVNWSLLTAETSKILTIVLLSLITLLLNSSSIELALSEDVNLNQELQAAGIANTLGGLGGGMIAFQSVSTTLLAAKLGSKSRLMQAFVTLFCGLALFGGSAPISLIPRLALGGVIVMMGVELLWSWVWVSRQKLPQLDYFIVLLILAVAAVIGYLPAIGLGLGVAIALFILNYSRIPVARHVRSGTTAFSSLARPLTQERLLRQEGEQVYILDLQGFLFFGTANAMLNQVRQRASLTDSPLHFVLLDFRLVNGLDSSAVLSFARMNQLAKAHPFQLIYTHLNPTIRQQLEQGGVLGKEATIFDDLERGLAWCEESILKQASWRRQRTLPLPLQIAELFPDPKQADVFLKHLQEQNVDANTVITRTGDSPGPIHFVESGLLSVLVELGDDRTRRIQTLRDGDVLGEMAFCGNEPQNFTVIAEEPSTLYVLSRESFEAIQQESPQAALAFQNFMMRRLSDRLRQANEEIKILLQ